MPPQSSQVPVDVEQRHQSFSLNDVASAASCPSIEEPRRVRFAEDLNEVQEVKGIHEYSMKERDAVWLTRFDWEQIEEGIRADLMRSALKGRRRPAGEPDPSRGLEWKNHEGSQQRLKNYQKGLFSVMAEQQRQRIQRGQQDPDRIAMMYEHAVGHCQAKANTIGMQDEIAVVKDPEFAQFKASLVNTSN